MACRVFYTSVNKLPIQALSLQLVAPEYTYKHLLYTINSPRRQTFSILFVCLFVFSLTSFIITIRLLPFNVTSGCMYQTAKSPDQFVLSSLQLVSMFRIPNRSITQKSLFTKDSQKIWFLSCIWMLGGANSNQKDLRKHSVRG